MMNKASENDRRRFPVAAVVITAVITLIAAGSSAYLLGYLSTDAGDTQMAEGSHEHEEDTLYTCGMHPQIISEEPGNCPICGMELVPKKSVDQADDAGSGEREIAYWRAPMDPNEIYEEPGKSAMGMDLVPVYEDELVGGVNISINPAVEQNMGIRVARAKKGPLVHTIRTYGHITYDETRMTRVNLKYDGWIEKLHIDFLGQKISKGDPMFEIYSPDLITVQQDLIEASVNYKRQASSLNKRVLASVRSRLRYFDISDSEIKNIEKQGAIQRTMTIRSPYTGVVTAKNALEGDFIKSGTTIYEIADLSRVWVEAHIYEYELSDVRKGLAAEMTLPYLPGKTYTGKVAFIYPYLQRQTRDVVVRLEFENPEMELKPDMYADVSIRTTPADGVGIHVPKSAVLRSGRRNIVFVRQEPGKFTPREITLGVPLDNDRIRVLSGIAPGEEVVTSGQFLLDSESKLREATSKMVDEEKPRNGEKAQTPDDETDGFFEEMEEQETDGFFDDLENHDH